MNEIGFVGDQAVKHIRDLQDFVEHGGIHLSGQPGHFAETFKFFWAIISVRWFSREAQSVKGGATVTCRRAWMEIENCGVIADSGGVDMWPGHPFTSSANLNMVVSGKPGLTIRLGSEVVEA
jgi:hypothetical protein